MPYISDKNKRQMLKPIEVAETKGELNYQICAVMQAYLDRQEQVGYDEIADVLSSVHEAEAEFRRRVLVPYEEGKIETNGDIFEWSQYLTFTSSH